MSAGWKAGFKAAKHKRLTRGSSPTVTFTPLHSTTPSPCKMSGVWLCCSLPAPYLLPLTGAQKIHNHSALCQTDNPQHKPEERVCVRVCVGVYVHLFAVYKRVRDCVLVCVLCLRGGGEDKGETKQQRGFGGRKVMGLWGSQNESKL